MSLEGKKNQLGLKEISILPLEEKKIKLREYENLSLVFEDMNNSGKFFTFCLENHTGLITSLGAKYGFDINKITKELAKKRELKNDFILGILKKNEERLLNFCYKYKTDFQIVVKEFDGKNWLEIFKMKLTSKTNFLNQKIK